MMKVGFTAGAFDLLHAGHVLMLEECASKCDHLIVGLHTNPHIERPDKNPPVQSVVERYIQLKAVKFVSEIIPYETEKDLVDLLLSLSIDVRFLGSDWRGKDFTGKRLGGTKHKIIYNNRDHCYSSSDLRKRIKNIK
jgi:glycerol-3-phosphate cytidylyltransferase